MRRWRKEQLPKYPSYKDKKLSPSNSTCFACLDPPLHLFCSEKNLLGVTRSCFSNIYYHRFTHDGVPITHISTATKFIFQHEWGKQNSPSVTSNANHKDSKGQHIATAFARAIVLKFLKGSEDPVRAYKMERRHGNSCQTNKKDHHLEPASGFVAIVTTYETRQDEREQYKRGNSLCNQVDWNEGLSRAFVDVVHTWKKQLRCTLYTWTSDVSWSKSFSINPKPNKWQSQVL